MTGFYQKLGYWVTLNAHATLISFEKGLYGRFDIKNRESCFIGWSEKNMRACMKRQITLSEAPPPLVERTHATFFPNMTYCQY